MCFHQFAGLLIELTLFGGSRRRSVFWPFVVAPISRAKTQLCPLSPHPNNFPTVDGTHFSSPPTNEWSFATLMKRYKSLPEAGGQIGWLQLSVFMHSRQISMWVSPRFLPPNATNQTFPFLHLLHCYSPTSYRKGAGKEMIDIY